MKFQLTFKTPDVADQLDDMTESEREEALQFTDQYVRYGEYVNIVFDTKTKTVEIMRV